MPRKSSRAVALHRSCLLIEQLPTMPTRPTIAGCQKKGPNHRSRTLRRHAPRVRNSKKRTPRSRQQFELALVVYDAGNHDVDTFVAAMDKTTSGAWGLWGGCVPVDAATAKELFRRVKARLKR